MLLSAVSVLVVAQSSSENPEGLMNNPVFAGRLLESLVVEIYYYYYYYYYYYSYYLFIIYNDAISISECAASNNGV